MDKIRQILLESHDYYNKILETKDKKCDDDLHLIMVWMNGYNGEFGDIQVIKKYKKNDCIDIDIDKDGKNGIYRGRDYLFDMYGLLHAKTYKQLYNLCISVMRSRCNLITDYSNNYFKLYGYLPKIHISKELINIAGLKGKKSSYFKGKVFYNPNGFWYSCGDSWSKSFSLLCGNKNRYNENSYFTNNISFRWSPLHVYVLDISQLNICKMSSCADIKKFAKKYKSNKIKDLAHYIDWKRVYDDYDGIELCPWQGKYCIDAYRKLYERILKTKINSTKKKSTKKNSTKKLSLKNTNSIGKYIEKTFKINALELLVSDIAVGNYTIDDFYAMWQIGFDGNTGVIWKNYKNIKMHKLA